MPPHFYHTGEAFYALAIENDSTLRFSSHDSKVLLMESFMFISINLPTNFFSLL